MLRTGTPKPGVMRKWPRGTMVVGGEERLLLVPTKFGYDAIFNLLGFAHHSLRIVGPRIVAQTYRHRSYCGQCFSWLLEEGGGQKGSCLAISP